MLQELSTRPAGSPDTTEAVRIFAEIDEDPVVEVTYDGKSLKIDKRNEDLIINDECKKIMRNLCSAQPREAFQSGAAKITQPSFLSLEDRVLYFKTKMFYLLQERHCFMEQQVRPKYQVGLVDAGNVAPAEAYPPFLSPFCNFTTTTPELLLSAPVARRYNRQPTEIRILTDQKPAGKGHRSKPVQNLQKTGLVTFLEHIRKADQSVLHMLDEKLLKTTEGAGYATLFGGVKDLRKVDVILSLFPDNGLLLLDGKDEESMLNNLASHVRTRMKMFDKLQVYYENPNREDHTAHVFTGPNVEAHLVREELVDLIPKRLHHMTENKVTKLLQIFRDDYGSAKTTLIADGTQPIVLNREKLDRVKRYVDECADWKGSMLVPYVRETNFFFLMFPWTRRQSLPTTSVIGPELSRDSVEQMLLADSADQMLSRDSVEQVLQVDSGWQRLPPDSANQSELPPDSAKP